MDVHQVYDVTIAPPLTSCFNSPGTGEDREEETAKFEWDDHKNDENHRKHGIRFEQVIPAFFDDHAVYYEDDRAAYGEQRMSCWVLHKTGCCLLCMWK